MNNTDQSAVDDMANDPVMSMIDGYATNWYYPGSPQDAVDQANIDAAMQPGSSTPFATYAIYAFLAVAAIVVLKKVA